MSRAGAVLPAGNGLNGDPSYWAREKGIGGHLALEMALGAERDACDVAMVSPADLDLLAAIDAVRSAGKRRDRPLEARHRNCFLADGSGGPERLASAVSVRQACTSDKRRRQVE